ncbi:hypothetical protein K2173_003818 [Erythroxylum novogranatense]|uniref:Uncharacterized protein n=1 Tax=Erythroxylum novogranatense TaxID=1862640 RepID=A0AAV8SJI6_9ROSI|nr:hypothetical protein K2173_003818 [Erythroxylum novogranatense]
MPMMSKWNSSVGLRLSCFRREFGILHANGMAYAMPQGQGGSLSETKRASVKMLELESPLMHPTSCLRVS